MTWEGFTNWLTNISNNPVFISLSSILAALGSILVIIGRTSFGKKAINQLTSLSEITREEVTDKVKEVNNKLKELKEQKNSLLNEMEAKFKTFYNQFEFYETQLFAILELIPNAKVQAQLEVLKSQWEEKKKEIEEFVGISYIEYQNKLSELEKEIEELKNGRVDDKAKKE